MLRVKSTLLKEFTQTTKVRERQRTAIFFFSLKIQQQNNNNNNPVSPSLKVHDSMLGEFACLTWCPSVRLSWKEGHPPLDGSRFQCRNGRTSLWHSPPPSLDAVVYRNGCLVLTCPHTSEGKLHFDSAGRVGTLQSEYVNLLCPNILNGAFMLAPLASRFASSCEAKRRSSPKDDIIRMQVRLLDRKWWFGIVAERDSRKNPTFLAFFWKHFILSSAKHTSCVSIFVKLKKFRRSTNTICRCFHWLNSEENSRIILLDEKSTIAFALGSPYFVFD